MARKDLKNIVTNTYRKQGDAIFAQKIIAQARNISRPIAVAGTSRHNIQELVLRENALCVVDIPFKLKEGAMRLKR